MPEHPSHPALSDEELEAQEAIDLPDREALSLFGTSGILGGPPLATGDPASGTPPTADPSSTTDTTTATPTTGDPTGLADRLSGLQGKVVGGQ